MQKLYAAKEFEDLLFSLGVCLPKDAAGNFISEHEKSDVVHDFLVFLAEQMLEMNKEKQEEVKGFLSWLEGEIGAKMDELSPKTKLQGYYNLKFNEFHDVLKKNKNKLKIDISRREPTERLKDEFQLSINKLQPLFQRLEQTDELIDQIVYKLYGLTEDEIKIVEGMDRRLTIIQE